MITAAVVLLALWFGFELGRKWEQGKAEEETERHAETHVRGKIRLNTIRVRR